MAGNTIVRSLAVLAAGVVVALAVFGVFRLAGIDPVVDNNGEEAIGVADVLVASLVGGLAAWAVVSALKTLGYVRWWPFVGSTALVISMLGPAYMSDGSSAMALMTMHIAVAIVLIWGLAQIHMAESSTRRESSRKGSQRMGNDPMRS